MTRTVGDHPLTHAERAELIRGRERSTADADQAAAAYHAEADRKFDCHDATFPVMRLFQRCGTADADMMAVDQARDRRYATEQIRNAYEVALRRAGTGDFRGARNFLERARLLESGLAARKPPQP